MVVATLEYFEQSERAYHAAAFQNSQPYKIQSQNGAQQPPPSPTVQYQALIALSCVPCCDVLNVLGRSIRSVV